MTSRNVRVSYWHGWMECYQLTNRMCDSCAKTNPVASLINVRARVSIVRGVSLVPDVNIPLISDGSTLLPWGDASRA